MIYKVAFYWAMLFGAATLLMLICAATGMAFFENATTSPDDYPARFLVWACVFLAWGGASWPIVVFGVVSGKLKP